MNLVFWSTGIVDNCIIVCAAAFINLKGKIVQKKMQSDLVQVLHATGPSSSANPRQKRFGAKPHLFLDRNYFFGPSVKPPSMSIRPTNQRQRQANQASQSNQPIKPPNQRTQSSQSFQPISDNQASQPTNQRYPSQQSQPISALIYAIRVLKPGFYRSS